jgi:hypothetical protein
MVAVWRLLARIGNCSSFNINISTIYYSRPSIRIWDIEELSMKLERHLDCEAMDFALLGDDWTKIVIMR